MPEPLLSRPMRIVLIRLAASLCLVVSTQAQHGGGGGYGGGGHFGGGHFGGSGHSSRGHAGRGHTAGRWGWLHFGRKRSSRERAISGNVASDLRPAEVTGSRNRFPAIPSTYIRAIPSRSLVGSPPERFSTYDYFRRHPDFFPYRFRRFPGSGCFFNGFNQVCFFEPAWPLLCFTAGDGWFPLDWGFGDDTASTPDGVDWEDMMAAPAEAPANGQNDTQIPAPPVRGQELDRRWFLLILTNGAGRIVTDYWLADGYIEYVSPDGTRSHIPVDALDLQETVRNNAARGLSFVLRSTP
jgi:hypothetical protein